MNKDFRQYAKQSLDLASQAIKRHSENLDINFDYICEAILACKGHIVVTGMGKSGHIGRKISATLASTGTPSFFLHPAEAGHGDLGMVTKNDLILALSNSGNAVEILTLFPIFKRLGIKVISITGDANSTIAQESDLHLLAKVEKEACPLNLAPTTSTSLALALGDAIAVALLNARGFKEEDFAFSHPSGKLGRKLLLKVEEIMHFGEDLPKVAPDVKIIEALLEMTRGKLGFLCIVDATDNLLGIYTDGDIRRSLMQKVNINQVSIKEVMIKNPVCIEKETLAAKALAKMQEKKINALAVLDKNGKLIGATNMHDFLNAGVA